MKAYSIQPVIFDIEDGGEAASMKGRILQLTDNTSNDEAW